MKSGWENLIEQNSHNFHINEKLHLLHKKILFSIFFVTSRAISDERLKWDENRENSPFIHNISIEIRIKNYFIQRLTTIDRKKFKKLFLLRKISNWEKFVFNIVIVNNRVSINRHCVEIKTTTFPFPFKK